jgi:hypothetical protein
MLYEEHGRTTQTHQCCIGMLSNQFQHQKTPKNPRNQKHLKTHQIHKTQTNKQNKQTKKIKDKKHNKQKTMHLWRTNREPETQSKAEQPCCNTRADKPSSEFWPTAGLVHGEYCACACALHALLHVCLHVAYMLLACCLHVPPPLWACGAGFGEGALLSRQFAVNQHPRGVGTLVFKLAPLWCRHTCGVAYLDYPA